MSWVRSVVFACVVATSVLDVAAAHAECTDVDVKVTGDAQGCIAISGAGTAQGDRAIVGLGHADGRTSIAGAGNASGESYGVVVYGCAEGRVSVSVSEACRPPFLS